ncbi:DUF3515 domain-containing protein [Streptomyces acidiscabies]|uniref:Uncharacterized protein n=1 Tax=Streptomyces acidiscabies TaxID=42234 RepID=A0A0L0KMG4_9ACTN|nr:DUF3515 domain-containing protein [Streptomyces acidiscabies]KND39412.1 hypothetical protein IQ63_03275 [Streptomyces acidiscabies]GAV40825.1 hypothetical protein Saa2_03725 [Streptomyces acidiscabies]
MNFFRHRLSGLSALALLCAAGCSSADDSAPAPVPGPSAKAAEICRKLDAALPSEVDGLQRRDPEPASPLTAGWGDPAIILRCGVVKPPKMDDDGADAGEADGVGWLVEKQDNGTVRFTSALRVVYVEVTLPKSRAAEGMSPLIDLAPAMKKTVPEGIAD